MGHEKVRSRAADVGPGYDPALANLALDGESPPMDVSRFHVRLGSDICRGGDESRILPTGISAAPGEGVAAGSGRPGSEKWKRARHCDHIAERRRCFQLH